MTDGNGGRREQNTGELIRALTVVGMLTYIGWVFWLFQVVQRASRIGASASVKIIQGAES